jgi:DNA-binding IscR family transcriptional regulator
MIDAHLTWRGCLEIEVLCTNRLVFEGAWRRLATIRPLSEITLEEAQRALDARVVTFPSTHDESPGCLIEKVIYHALDDAAAEANHVLDRRLATITLADIAADVYQLDRAISSTPKDNK